MTDYTLPEFCFLDSQSQEGNLLEGRTVLQHVRSYTIIEVVALDEVLSSDFSKSKTYAFEYKNHFGIVEKHLFVLHFSLSGDDDYILQDIFKKCEKWYCDYLTWEDRNIKSEATSNLN